MSEVRMTLSPRLKALFDRGQLERQFRDIGEAAARFLLGLPYKRRTSHQAGAILRRGFKKWRGQQNKTTRGYQDYSERYEQWKDEQGHKNWHMVSGSLFEDAILKPKIRASSGGFSITVSKGGSREYAAVQQYGHKAKPRIPARPYYEMDDADKKTLGIFIENRLAQAFKTEARYGTIT